MQGRPVGGLVFKSESDRDWVRSRGTGVKQRNVHVLLIEDDPEDVMLVERSLGKPSDAFHPFTLEHSFALQEGLDRLGKGDTDSLLLDLDLADSQGVAVRGSGDPSHARTSLLVDKQIGRAHV